MRYLKCGILKAIFTSRNWTMPRHLRMCTHIPSIVVHRAGSAHTFWKRCDVTLWEVTVFSGGQETDIGVGSTENFSGRQPLNLEGVAAIDQQTQVWQVIWLYSLINQPTHYFWIYLASPTHSQRASPSLFGIYMVEIPIDSVCLIIHYSSIIYYQTVPLGFFALLP